MTEGQFILDTRLAKDTYPVIDNEDFYLGLHKNALVTWLILVPKTDETELFACPTPLRTRIRETIDTLAPFLQQREQADKMNIATIGNVVAQLHIHIIARKTTDFAWPNPVWGNNESVDYSTQQKDAIIADIREHLNSVST